MLHYCVTTPSTYRAYSTANSALLPTFTYHSSLPATRYTYRHSPTYLLHMTTPLLTYGKLGEIRHATRPTTANAISALARVNTAPAAADRHMRDAVRRHSQPTTTYQPPTVCLGVAPAYYSRTAVPACHRCYHLLPAAAAPRPAFFCTIPRTLPYCLPATSTFSQPHLHQPASPNSIHSTPSASRCHTIPSPYQPVFATAPATSPSYAVRGAGGWRWGRP